MTGAVIVIYFITQQNPSIIYSEKYFKGSEGKEKY